ncbi:hypothetical protein K438DRAFT_2017226 [Mycena galopus ATCC 62051]|nr:hypothetical protein K438DRAFT_2017226 [Mycena galopus ATCC 62051]
MPAGHRKKQVDLGGELIPILVSMLRLTTPSITFHHRGLRKFEEMKMNSLPQIDMKIFAFAALGSPLILTAAAVPLYGHIIPSQVSLAGLMGPLFALWNPAPYTDVICSTAPSNTLMQLPAKIPQFDPPLKLGTRLGSGSRGNVYDVEGRPDVVAKQFFTAEANDKNIDKFFRPEAYALDKLGQFVDWGFQTEFRSGTKYYYILMQKLPGKKLTMTQAYIAAKSGADSKAKLKALMTPIYEMVARQSFAYTQAPYFLYHEDITQENVLFEEAGGQITKAHIVDWGQYSDVKGKEVKYDKVLREVKLAFDRFE